MQSHPPRPPAPGRPQPTHDEGHPKHRTAARWWAAALAALATLAAVAGCGHETPAKGGPGADRSGFTLAPLAGGGTERGAGYLEQNGHRLSGWLVLWGLEPNSSHASHLHANPVGETDASCPNAQTTRHAFDFDDLEADENGVATAEIDVMVREQIVRPGVYWMVHHNATDADEHHPGSGNPGLMCGDLMAAEAAP